MTCLKENSFSRLSLSLDIVNSNDSTGETPLGLSEPIRIQPLPSHLPRLCFSKALYHFGPILVLAGVRTPKSTTKLWEIKHFGWVNNFFPLPGVKGWFRRHFSHQ